MPAKDCRSRQFVLYGDALARVDPVRTLYLAVREQAFDELFEEPLGQLLLESKRARLVVVDVARREVVRWVR